MLLALMSKGTCLLPTRDVIDHPCSPVCFPMVEVQSQVRPHQALPNTHQ